ncbi:MAG: dihydrolipoyl dehydrogenase [Chloroflexota bacterium]|nr:dihydrolipoyl dehydrogenase [Chloroflexota bacterium]
MEYDVLIIGGGLGGYVAAIRAAQLGGRVALVEKDRLGGTCLNRGCIPTKALVRSVNSLREAKAAAQFGVVVSEPAFDFAAMQAHKDAVVARLVDGVEGLLKAHRVDFYPGTGTIARPGLVRVTAPDSSLTELLARHVIVATGSVASRPPIAGLNTRGVLIGEEILNLEQVPHSLIVIGGGVVGLEFASIFQALGCQVTVIEMLPTLLPPIDQEISRRYGVFLRKSGTRVFLKARVEEINPTGTGQVSVRFSTGDREQHESAERVLVATGRVPFSDELGLEALEVKREKGAVVVNERLQTNVPRIYAVGDVTGTVMLAHVASRQGEVAAENILGHRAEMNYRAVPNCVFTDPEIAGVGLTEQGAKEQGRDYTVAKFPFSASGKALAMGETDGLVKLICEQGSGQVLGMHVMGPHASDLIAEGALAVQLGATAKDIADTIHAHPTLAEATMEAAKQAAYGAAIHYQQKRR